MRKTLYTMLASVAVLMAAGCNNLDLSSPSSPSTENWYSNADEIRISLNEMYRLDFYDPEKEYWTDRRSDDWAQRNYSYELPAGSATSSSSAFNTFWENTYKAISRSIRVIESIGRLDDPSLDALYAEACFFRAYFYARLVTLWGDVPFYTSTISTEQAFTMGRTDKETVKAQVYKDFDVAIAGLPEVNNTSGTYRVTKGAALALKARYALYWGDYEECAARSKEVMDLDVYSLYSDYGELFRKKGYTEETIFALANSYEYAQTQSIKSWVLRTAGGNAVAQPSWDLLAAYECTDGKTIDQSPLFDPHNPYADRDPRCAETFVVPGTKVYGIVYDPNPLTLTVWDDNSGQEIRNKDNKTIDVNCAYNGCALRKGAQDEWRTGLYSENPIIIMRYADVLLMYAEAKIELGQIDNTVLNAINDVRARAYGVSRNETSSYPAVTSTSQDELRKIVRRERRVELAWEGKRFYDLRRWGLLKKAYSVNMYGILSGEKLKNYAKEGNWFWPETPSIDEDGFADFSPWAEKGYIQLNVLYRYDPKSELFPIPDDEIIINPNLVQNPGY